MDDLKYEILDSKIDKIDAKIDKILEHSANTDITLGSQAVQLEIHIKRTDLLEKKVAEISDHTHMVNAVTKVAGVAIGSSGLIFGLLKYLKLV